MSSLAELAEAAGISPRWLDVHGRWHDVSPDTLRAVLSAMGIDAGSDQATAASLDALREASGPAPLLTATVGEPIPVPLPPGRYQVLLEGGGTQDGVAEAGPGGAVLPGIQQPGYHTLHLAGRETVLAVAPRRCFTVRDAAPNTRPWGLAVQLYGLRRDGSGGLGDFRALAELAGPAARHGAAAVAISPVHAQFSADIQRFSPYSPSSRTMLNVLHAGLDLPPGPLDDAALVDWPAASRARLDALGAAFSAMPAAERTGLAAFRAEMGETLETHARFEALHEHLYGRDPGLWHWRSWPEQYRHPESPAVAAFAAAHADAVSRHAYMQFRADQDLAAAQRAMRDAGMPIGLISDLAVGADSGGSHCWARQSETLLGLTIGAPPDLLSTKGQSWGLAAFSPRGLARHGFAAYIEMLRNAMRHAGGVRIDHALGLARLWVVPDGAEASEGAYLAFPMDDLLRLIALESYRHRAIVLGEDLGTIPEGFQDRLRDAGILGMRVLWFERDEAGFAPPGSWTRDAAGMTSTHDLSTVAGWWKGRDLDWRGRLDLAGGADGLAREQAARGRDRGLLWSAMQESGAAAGEAPEDAPEDAAAAVDAATRHVAASACDLVIVPLEDVLALPEQPNLPGTTDGHPNWRRRMPAPLPTLLDQPGTAARLAGIHHARNLR